MVSVKSTLPAFAQEDSTAVVSAFGVGNNESDALHNAIVSAINQIFSTYITTQTEIINDSVAVNKFSAISNGNIKSYQIIKSEKTGDGHYVTIKAEVNLKNTINFCKSLGIEAEIQGGFMSNTLSLKLKNIEAEEKVFSSFEQVFKNEIKNIFNNTITAESPIKATNTNNFLIKVKSNVEVNHNFNSILNVLIDIIDNAALPIEELADYRKFNLEFYPVFIQTQEKTCFRFLRSKNSLKALVRYILNIDESLRTHIIKRNDGKELSPNSLSPGAFNFLYYNENGIFRSYKLFANGIQQRVEIGKLAFKGNKNDEKTLASFIASKYNQMDCIDINESNLLETKYEYNGLTFIELPFFFLTSKCQSQPFSFTYNDWVSLDDLKKISKYSIIFN